MVKRYIDSPCLACGPFDRCNSCKRKTSALGGALPAESECASFKRRAPLSLTYVPAVERLDPDRSNLHISYRRSDQGSQTMLARVCDGSMASRLSEVGKLARLPGVLAGQTHYSVRSVENSDSIGQTSVVTAEWFESEMLMKSYFIDLGAEPSAARCFHKTATAVGRLDHPNISAVYDFGWTPDCAPYVVRSRYQGHSLSEWIKSGALSDPLPIFIDVCSALAHAHDKKILHGRLNPSKIVLAARGRGDPLVKVLDFAVTATLKSEGYLKHAPINSYASPEELFEGRSDCRSDIFSLGCIMYETLTGRMPVNAGRAWQILPFEKSMGVSSELERIVMRCLALSPNQRYQSAHELLSDLHSLDHAGQSSLVLPYVDIGKARFFGAMALVAAVFGPLWTAQICHLVHLGGLISLLTAVAK